MHQTHSKDAFVINALNIAKLRPLKLGNNSENVQCGISQHKIKLQLLSWLAYLFP